MHAVTSHLPYTKTAVIELCPLNDPTQVQVNMVSLEVTHHFLPRHSLNESQSIHDVVASGFLSISRTFTRLQ